MNLPASFIDYTRALLGNEEYEKLAAALQQEVKEDKIQVLTLCPGGMATNDMVTKAILAQGLWGWLTTNPLERVARKTLDRALQGKSRYVPGAINQALFALGKVVPRSWAATIVYRRWKKRKKSGLNKPLF